MDVIEPVRLAEEFKDECEKILNKKLFLYIWGSVRKGNFIEGKSDIDIMLFAKEDDVIGWGDWLKLLESPLKKDMALKGVKYDNIRKRPLIDLMFTSPKAQITWKKELNKINILPVNHKQSS